MCVSKAIISGEGSEMQWVGFDTHKNKQSDLFKFGFPDRTWSNEGAVVVPGVGSGGIANIHMIVITYRHFFRHCRLEDFSCDVLHVSSCLVMCGIMCL